MLYEFIQDGIIEAQEAYRLVLNAQDNINRIVFIDATFVLPNSGENILDNYTQSHIPDALFFDITKTIDEQSDLPHMLPNEAQFAAAMSDIGITNNDFIIVYGQHGIALGPARLWWMLQGFGHEKVVVLDGGLPAWEAANLSIVSGAPQICNPPSEFTAKPFNKKLYATREDILSILDSQLYPIIDARPAARFDGSSPEPRQGMRSGHIPESHNIPSSTIVNDDGTMKSHEELKDILHNIGIDIGTEFAPDGIITTCGSGITACALSLALYHIGYDSVFVYDGSWSEWGHEDSGTPIAKTA